MICKILDSGSLPYVAQNPDNPVNPVQKQRVFCQPPSKSYATADSENCNDNPKSTAITVRMNFIAWAV